MKPYRSNILNEYTKILLVIYLINQEGLFFFNELLDIKNRDIQSQLESDYATLGGLDPLNILLVLYLIST